MSAPTPAPGDDRPREGYYPDPSIPGYVRYWNGAAWVPGTSRPAPSDGEPLAPPPGSGSSGAVEETGPHFFDEDPAGDDAARAAADPNALHGSRPEPASAWGADRSRQTGFGGDKDRRVSWGSAPGADPRLSLSAGTADTTGTGDAGGSADGGGPAGPTGAAGFGDPGRTASTDGTASIPPADDEAGSTPGTVVFRRPNSSGAPEAAVGGTEPAPTDGTMTFRPSSSRAGQQDGTAPAAPAAFGAHLTPAQVAAQQALGLTPQSSSPTSAPSGPQDLSVPQQGPQSGGTAPAAAASAPVPAAAAPAPQQPAFGGAFPPAPQAAQSQSPSPQAAAPPLTPGVPQQPAAPQSADTPMAVGIGGGQPSWAQQVHRLAGGDGEQPVAPWKPVVEDPFQAAARRQAEARPAGLGRRLAARLVDSLVVGGVTAVAAVPFGGKAVDHIDEKIDAAKLSGEKVTVWLVDGTTSVYLGIILGVLFLVSAAYEVLPTAKWGRTLGKRLFGIEVRDIEGHEPPSFMGSLRRWLVHTVSGLLGIGVVGVLWCVWDKPWRQCWHDKAAHTFVAGD
ncbi:RDD family protein [Streptomyces sp. ID01-12c]|uniref:RDD family protein n=1 Tax=Streptomyces caniscabiei TaxID=2746961 RepID=UPI0017836E80|nr:RDD family protein [Streptomyces caniscabiei]MBD9702218.1 RDD family protein [Streptomyces caniscabiei]MDX3730342.1 RDD family protein [Streptomyces caniscabiei]